MEAAKCTHSSQAYALLDSGAVLTKYRSPDLCWQPYSLRWQSVNSSNWHANSLWCSKCSLRFYKINKKFHVETTHLIPPVRLFFRLFLCLWPSISDNTVRRTLTKCGIGDADRRCSSEDEHRGNGLRDDRISHKGVIDYLLLFSIFLNRFWRNLM